MKSPRSSSSSEGARWMGSNVRRFAIARAPASVSTSLPTGTRSSVASTASVRAMRSTTSPRSIRRIARGSSAIASSLLTNRASVTASIRSPLSGSSATSLTIAEASRYRGAWSAIATRLFERLRERHALAGQLDRPEIACRPRCGDHLPLGDQAVERSAAAHRSQLGHGAVAIGHDEALSALDAAQVLAEVLPQLGNAHRVAHVHEGSTYVTDCWYTVNPIAGQTGGTIQKRRMIFVSDQPR